MKKLIILSTLLLFIVSCNSQTKAPYLNSRDAKSCTQVLCQSIWIPAFNKIMSDHHTYTLTPAINSFGEFHFHTDSTVTYKSQSGEYHGTWHFETDTARLRLYGWRYLVVKLDKSVPELKTNNPFFYFGKGNKYTAVSDTIPFIQLDNNGNGNFWEYK